jgi:hypothetical protein
MEAKLDTQADFSYQGRPVSALGLRLRKIREQIEAAAARGETKLLNKEELDRLFNEMRPSDPDFS